MYPSGLVQPILSLRQRSRYHDRASPTATQSGSPVREPLTTGRRPWWVIALAVFSFLLFCVTEAPQFYYVLYEVGLVPIGPHTNALGEV
jgi:hypothetical protein